MDALEKAKLILAKVEILKLKADDYNWACHTPNDVKEQIEQTLREIDELLKPQPPRGDE